MEYEKLALELSAAKAGLRPVKPGVLHGESGVEHRVTVLFTDGSRFLGFDFYDKVTEFEVLRSYVKKLDTGATLRIVSLREEATEGAKGLAAGYGINILSPKAAEALLATEGDAPRASVDEHSSNS